MFLLPMLWANGPVSYMDNLKLSHKTKYNSILFSRYEVTLRSPWLWINNLLMIVVILTCIIYYSINEPDQMLAFGIIALVITLYSVYVYYDIRKIVIDLNKEEYSFYKSQHLVYRGHIHNVYIRLVGQKSGTGESPM